MSTDLDAEFQHAAAAITQLPERPDNDTLLKLYALYKQATVGDAKGPKPGFFDFVNTAKYEAWLHLRGMRADDAQRQYVSLVRQLRA
ncbi:MAG: acyl-CoA-binding protein [Rhodanobacteraceae bacterium]|nr:MAG: acyl-CoA-binding protein [Rhodanobacteraceae bacterium]